MTGNQFNRVCALALLTALGGSGCMTAHHPAPVSDRGTQPGVPAAIRPAQVAAPREGDPRPEYYTVKRGDTLYLIALDQGLDYKELAAWNNIDNPNVIRVGQQLRLRAPESAVATTPLQVMPRVEGRPVGAASAPPAAAGKDAVKSQPKAVKLPYSDQALAQLSGSPPAQQQAQPQLQPQVQPVVPPVAKSDPRPDEKPVAVLEDDEKINWGWPTSGKLLSTYNETTNLKGIGIGGKLGQPVIASAPGTVLYSGDGIRGYGKLVIIKHNKVYLSVYAHNSHLLVKEGQIVVKGQKIADMGSSDADQVNLHFEIRRFGKPIDPLKLLPN